MARKRSFGILGGTLALLVFSGLLQAARAQVFGVELYGFCQLQFCQDGETPYGPLLLNNATGMLYGTTFLGGANGDGTVFEFDQTLGEETVLYSFAGNTDGERPIGNLVQDKEGNLYGMTLGGGNFAGSCSVGCGTVFKVTPEGIETVLYRFCSADDCLDGWAPEGLVFGQDGNLYGTTCCGGSESSGIVFKLTPDGQETVLYNFCTQPDCSDGAAPSAPLILDGKGNFYGTTEFGGAYGVPSGGYGTVFKLTPKGHETVLYSFAGSPDGVKPSEGPLVLENGNLYGTTINGGAYNSTVCVNGCGVVFEVTQKGHETVLHSFGYGQDGSLPYAGLALDREGRFWGVTTAGGSSGDGSAFVLDPLYYPFFSLIQGIGVAPRATLIFDDLPYEALLGTAQYGGCCELGSIFMLEIIP
jgi:uncharacterized repeat protein (TIGR03803 family)